MQAPPETQTEGASVAVSRVPVGVSTDVSTIPTSPRLTSLAGEESELLTSRRASEPASGDEASGVADPLSTKEGCRSSIVHADGAVNKRATKIGRSRAVIDIG